jgi:hypothetical protein
VPIVLLGDFLARRHFCRLSNTRCTSLFDVVPDAGADAGQEGDAVRGAFGGVGEDDRLLVDVGLQLPPEIAAGAAAAGADLGDRGRPSAS